MRAADRDGRHRQPDPEQPVRRTRPSLDARRARHSHRGNRAGPPAQRIHSAGAATSAHHAGRVGPRRRVRQAQAQRHRQRHSRPCGDLAAEQASRRYAHYAPASGALDRERPHASAVLLPDRGRRDRHLARRGRSARRHRTPACHEPRGAARCAQAGDRCGQDHGHGDADRLADAEHHRQFIALHRPVPDHRPRHHGERPAARAAARRSEQHLHAA